MEYFVEKTSELDEIRQQLAEQAEGREWTTRRARVSCVTSSIVAKISDKVTA